MCLTSTISCRGYGHCWRPRASPPLRFSLDVDAKHRRLRRANHARRVHLDLVRHVVGIGGLFGAEFDPLFQHSQISAARIQVSGYRTVRSSLPQPVYAHSPHQGQFGPHLRRRQSLLVTIGTTRRKHSVMLTLSLPRRHLVGTANQTLIVKVSIKHSGLPPVPLLAVCFSPTAPRGSLHKGHSRYSLPHQCGWKCAFEV